MSLIMAIIPPEIDLWFWINEEILRSIERPVEVIDINTLSNNLTIPYLESLWTDDRNLTPQMLIDNFSFETRHANKVQNVDTQYPIEIYFFKNQWIILDGVHRFTKLIMQWAQTIQIRRVSEDLIPLIKKTDEEFRRWKWEIIS